MQELNSPLSRSWEAVLNGDLGLQRNLASLRMQAPVHPLGIGWMGTYFCPGSVGMTPTACCGMTWTAPCRRTHPCW